MNKLCSRGCFVLPQPLLGKRPLLASVLGLRWGWGGAIWQPKPELHSPPSFLCPSQASEDFLPQGPPSLEGFLPQFPCPALYV